MAAMSTDMPHCNTNPSNMVGSLPPKAAFPNSPLEIASRTRKGLTILINAAAPISTVPAIRPPQIELFATAFIVGFPHRFLPQEPPTLEPPPAFAHTARRDSSNFGRRFGRPAL